MTYFIVTDRDRIAIFGIGGTEADALAEANEFAEKGENPDDWRIQPCTRALYDQVHEIGGNIAWGYLPDGTACTCGEEDAAHVA